jgi:ribosomal protein S12 methylthiotransferase
MKNNSSLTLTRKKAAIITNNVHCGRHVQHYSTIEKYFKANGWIISDDFNVNKIVICACGFHDAVYEKIMRTLKEIKKLNFLEKNIIITACLTKTHEQDLKRNFKGQIVTINREELLDDIVQAEIPFKDIPPVNMFQLNEKCNCGNMEYQKFHIKISQGCLRECTFCVINKAKGYINSLPFEKIARQVDIAIKRNQKKIKLMGEDTFAYGIDIGTNIIELVEKLTATYPGMEFYFGYLHIRWLQKYAKEILALCKKGVLKELQIGLQHVNDKMLRRMGRPAVFSEIYDIIRTIKKELPGFYLIADILVGFPGETEEMFNELVEFFKKDKCFNKVKHFGYSDVKGAPSSKFENKISQDEIALRWDRLDEVLGERAYSQQQEEARVDNVTFRATRFEDYFFCKNTYDETIERTAAPQELIAAESLFKKTDKTNFEF